MGLEVAAGLDPAALLLEKLNDPQKKAVQSPARRLLVVAGAGAGKTDVMARRIAWHVAIDKVPKDRIVAFTFTERAAEEMKFRIRKFVASITPAGSDATLGDMYIGTIHGFCLDRLRKLDPDTYHAYDVLDDVSRLSLIERLYYNVLGMRSHEKHYRGKFNLVDKFMHAYDLLNEYGILNVKLASGSIPTRVQDDRDWCTGATLQTSVGKTELAQGFASFAARYYAALRARRFLDFSTSQNELVQLLRERPDLMTLLQEQCQVVVVDEVQDLNEVQKKLLEAMTTESTRLTAVGDHRQAIFGFRGSRVEIMGDLYSTVNESSADDIVELAENYRSTPRIVDVANRWARRIGNVKAMTSPAMEHGNKSRADDDSSHVACLTFTDELSEAQWIATAIHKLVDGKGKRGARHGDRGISYADIAVLLRTTTSARTYIQALQANGIPAVARAGPDLFSQPEVLLFTVAMLGLSGSTGIPGSDQNDRSLPSRIRAVLHCAPETEATIRAAADVLKQEGLNVDAKAADRLILAVRLLREHLKPLKKGEIPGPLPKASDVAKLRSLKLRAMLERRSPRRVFPQALFLALCEEFDVQRWDDDSPRGGPAMYHLGALSSMITGLEASGWTGVGDLKYQLIALSLYGAKSGRADEQPLLVQPDAVTVATIHAVKGLEFAATFVADVRNLRFPSNRAKTLDVYPFGGTAGKVIKPHYHADNDQYDGERRLMYVALTRAERFLFVTSSRLSLFFREVCEDVAAAGGLVDPAPSTTPAKVTHADVSADRDGFRLITSFSDLRYYLACPHDFYLRKVLGFAPTIDQAFGYGRGVHNMLRAVHTNPAYYAALVKQPERLKTAVEELLSRGLFYMRYTTGDPLQNFEKRAVEVVTEYIANYAPELSHLRFEPERPFETLIEEAQALISGAIDVVRLDSPPRVTLVDFKSGNAKSDIASKLDPEEMRLQVTLYALAAKKELEQDPERGLVRYLGEADPAKRELEVPFNAAALEGARETVVQIAEGIRDRRYRGGPKPPPAGEKRRCVTCDFSSICAIQHLSNGARKTGEAP